MALKPWYNVVQPRPDLLEGKPQDAAQFAVHLDQVRDHRGPDIYREPREFFARTYLTTGLTAFAAEVIRRLSGERIEASAVFNLATQFGGGKTHALTLLYHLAKNGPAAQAWAGVPGLMDLARVASIPRADVAVFVGTEFDSLMGRGGGGTPVRKTPWGEIAWQLRGPEGLALVAEHEATQTAPGGDVLRALLSSDRPTLILLDELMNYVSRTRHSPLSAQLYSFLQNLSETARGMDGVVLAVSVPASELEMSAEDQADYDRFKKLLDRVGKAVVMSAETETAEIIRRRLFEWDLKAVASNGRVLLPREADATCRQYAAWAFEHRDQLPAWFPVDRAEEELAATYPFHPTVISVFERKWKTLPRFQQTRGVLRLLALWIANASLTGYKRAYNDPLITLGTAPLDDPTFRAALFEQLGEEQRLEGVVTTDITGKPTSHADRLDSDAQEILRKARVHRQVATSIFFESNGGMARNVATLPELRLTVAGPSLDIGNVETALEGLTATCYYLYPEGTRYRFRLTPTINKIFSDRRASIPKAQVSEEARAAIQRAFPPVAGGERIPFPEASGQIPDRPVFTLIVAPPEQSLDDRARTLAWLEELTRNAGASGRTFKSALVFAVPSNVNALTDAARNLLAWAAVDAEQRDDLDAGQQQQLEDALKKARSDLKEAVWRAYNVLFLLGKDNELRAVDLGLVHSSAANSMTDYVVQRLTRDGELVEEAGAGFLTRNWPPAFTEWSTRSVRDAFFASPLFPRLRNGDTIRQTIARAVTDGQLAYVGKIAIGQYDPFYFKEPLSPANVEISPDMYIIRKDTAEAYKAARDKPAPEPTPPVKQVSEDGEGLSPSPVAGGEASTPAVVTPPPAPTPQPGPSSTPTQLPQHITWSGSIPYQKWMNFYTKALVKLVSQGDLTLTVNIDFSNAQGIPQHRIDELKAALRELGLSDDVGTE
ncbi:MAG: DUF499 domain-containing protein [Anaerolineae bacterium]